MLRIAVLWQCPVNQSVGYDCAKASICIPQPYNILPMLGSIPSTSGRSLSTTAALRRPTACFRVGRCLAVRAVAESREYYDYKDMPPLPLTVTRITIPSLGYTVSAQHPLIHDAPRCRRYVHPCATYSTGDIAHISLLVEGQSAAHIITCTLSHRW